ncbi:MAG: molybdopterin molybdotransferase MoeA [Myxococcus sp.]|nr:molybdopterin molybdotransferase MoeA [Myxococcus sp.]
MLPVEVALERVLALAGDRLPSEAVPVAEALGRALAAPVTAQRTLPPWDNSAMDGYAVRAEEAVDGARLRVAMTIHAGDRPERALERGEAARIMTGAPMPPGADAVVMQERTTLPEPGLVQLSEAARPGLNVRQRGEDVAEGAPLLPAGRALGISEAAALWAQGLSSVTVSRRPTVAIASSGDELCDVLEAPNGRVVDTNTPVLAQLCRTAGALPTVLGRAPDRLDAMTGLFSKGLSFDVLLAVAGASVGEKDYTREALAAVGVEMDFWKVAMKPGKPLAVGRRGGTLVFGLPGNPVSAMVTFELFVRPALRQLQGLAPAPTLLPGRLATPITKAAGLRHFVRATVARRGDGLWATPLSSQSSGALASAAGATHLISIAPDATEVAEGAVVELIPLSWGT